MKISLALLLACFMMHVVAQDKIVGESNTPFGKYSIDVTTETVTYKGQKLESYQLCYDNCKSEILIGVQKLEGCKSFVVCLDDLQIVYTCKNGVFGVSKKPKQKSTSMNIKETLNTQQFAFQKMITSKPKTEAELLGLIACYYPVLIKSELFTQES
ncbi:MAG: hypothetical protein JEZ14_12525 [Marinilabiliaceae bacterium]|nr:hypothetical protein [Marinilabiliaceae bacterium]